MSTCTIHLWSCGCSFTLLLSGCSFLPDKSSLMDRTDEDHGEPQGEDTNSGGFNAGSISGLNCDDGRAGFNPCVPDMANVDEGDPDGDEVDGTDADGDGAASEASGGIDCDDDDPLVNPEATELCDGFDNDCDGAVDEDDAADGVAWYEDLDEDGYGVAETVVTACEQPEQSSSVAGDCDDGAPEVNPGAAEVCDADGVDEDCDGLVNDEDGSPAGSSTSTWYSDADGDGYGSDASSIASCIRPDGYVDNGDDCDDDDGSTWPGATEVCGDGVVNDCDGDASVAFESCGLAGDVDLADADAKLVGENAGDWAGRSVSGAGDVNGDGLQDLLIGASKEDSGGSEAGAAYVVLGAPTGTMDLSAADAKLVGEAGSDSAGYSVSNADDVDADGFDDVVIGAHDSDLGGDGSGAAYLQLGPIYGTMSLSAADVRIIGDTSGDSVGHSVSNAGDVDADGRRDLILGAEYEDSAGTGAGAAYLVLGPVSGDFDLSGADAKLIGENELDYAGFSVSSAGDANADGHTDLLVGAWANDAGADRAGAAYLVHGPISGSLDLADADAKLLGESTDDVAAWSVSGADDVDGDGRDDVLVGSHLQDAGGAEGGAAYLLLGPISGTSSLSAADTKFIAEDAGDNVGGSVSGAGDVDADGLADILIGAYGEGTKGWLGGAAYLVLDPTSGSFDLSDAHAKLVTEHAYDYAGGSVSSAGDVDGDSGDDLLLGAMAEDAGGDSAGAAYLVLGGEY